MLSFSYLLAQKPLEVEYPPITGIKISSQTTLPEYVKYIYNFFIIFTGIIALIYLIWAGLLYLTATGKAEQVKKAKERIKNTLLGILILLFSYLIIITINPEITVFKLPETEKPTSDQIPAFFKKEQKFPPDLQRMKEVVDKANIHFEALKDAGENLLKEMQKCNCKFSQPMCICKVYASPEYCKPDNTNPCYSATSTQPCPSQFEIRIYQALVAGFKDLLLYDKNRAMGESEDLATYSNKYLDPQIAWYDKTISWAQEVLNQLKTSIDIDLQKENIEALKKAKKELEDEKKCREDLKVLFDKLAMTVKTVHGAVVYLTELPEDCLKNVPKKCKGSCEGGCHDTLGCFPKICADTQRPCCSGGNPCPINEVQKMLTCIQAGKEIIAGLTPEIEKSLENLFSKSSCSGFGGTVTYATEISNSLASICSTSTKPEEEKPEEEKPEEEEEKPEEEKEPEKPEQPEKPDEPPPLSALEEDKRIRDELAKEGISVNKGCSNPDGYAQGGQTCLNGLRPETIEGVKNIKENCNCEITITGGTEAGHSSNTYSHGNGYKLDLRPNPSLNEYIASQGCSMAMNKNCRGADGNIYRYEGNHWDVCFNCAGKKI